MTDELNDNGRDGGTGAPPPPNAPPDDHPGPAADGKPLPGRELQRAREHVPDDEPALKPAKKVFRKTELPGTAPPVTRDGLKENRKRTPKNPKDPAPETPPRQSGTAFREFLCSLAGLQDRIRDVAVLHVADLPQRIDAPEGRLKTMVRHFAPGSPDVRG